MIARIWTAISLFAIVLQLVAIRGFDFRQVLLFVIPVLMALLISAQSPATRGSRLANLFLSLIGFGLLIAKLPWLFPDLGGLKPNLAPQIDRVLTWYCAVYLLFVSFILPCHLFTDSLHQHQRGNPAQLSRWTCYWGLFTTLILLPGMIWVAIRFLHILPIL